MKPAARPFHAGEQPCFPASLPASAVGPAGRLRRRLFGIDPSETSFVKRGFHGAGTPAAGRMEEIGRTFLTGYHFALEEDDLARLAGRLDTVERELRGFAYEGAAMALALRDLLPPRRRRLQAFIAGPGSQHAYMCYVGAGWLMGRVPFGTGRALLRADPLLGWLAFDGYGFHEGYFHPERVIRRQAVPRRLQGYARRAFNQGLGRSLWFVEGASADRIAETIAAFPLKRRSDLWSGVGLACAYAGGVDREELERLRTAAGVYAPQLAQGAAFAAKARQRAGNPTCHTHLACEVLCGVSADEAAAATDEALGDIPPEAEELAYEIWRRRVRDRLTREVVRR